MENKFCPKCGSSLSNDSVFCSNCGAKIEQNNVEVSNKQPVKSEDSNATILGIISLALYFAGSTVLSFITYFLPESFKVVFSSLIGLCPISGIIVMIVGRVKYPTNKFLKVVMWVIIGSIILGIVAVIIFMIWCYVTCANMDTSGCS